MASEAPEGSQYDDHDDTKMNDLTFFDGVYDSFDAMGLQENLLKGIYAYRNYPVPFCNGLDVVHQAQSGTRGTDTFLSGILEQVDVVQCQAVVLAPTRELALQIEKVMKALGDYLGAKVHACVGGGGTSMIKEDRRILHLDVHVVRTPGRVFGNLRRSWLSTDHIKLFVLDEADEILLCGFMYEIYDIFTVLPPWIQVKVFCSTMTSGVLEITRKLMNKPVRISVRRDVVLTREDIKQFYIHADKDGRKLETLGDQHINISTQAHQKRFNHDFKCQLSKRALLPTRLRKSGFREAIKQPRKVLH